MALFHAFGAGVPWASSRGGGGWPYPKLGGGPTGNVDNNGAATPEFGR